MMEGPAVKPPSPEESLALSRQRFNAAVAALGEVAKTQGGSDRSHRIREGHKAIERAYERVVSARHDLKQLAAGAEEPDTTDAA